MQGLRSPIRDWTRKDSRPRELRICARHLGRVLAAVLGSFLGLSLALTARADRTPLKPGFNLFSTDQDIQLGQKYSREVERELPMCNDPRVDSYLNSLGEKLASHAPGAKYPYQYKCVNDTGVNAFALPGGIVYINRGAIEMADNEAQLSGMLAHETAHVALRHSTNQLSKNSALEIGAALAGVLLGNNSMAGLLTQIGIRGGVELATLKFSRTDESEADILGTQILYDSGYDPRALAQFFEKLEAESKNQPIQFLSDHPNPANRAGRVEEEVRLLGGPPPDYKTDSAEFQKIRLIIHDLPQPPKKAAAPSGP